MLKATLPLGTEAASDPRICNGSKRRVIREASFQTFLYLFFFIHLDFLSTYFPFAAILFHSFFPPLDWRSLELKILPLPLLADIDHIVDHGDVMRAFKQPSDKPIQQSLVDQMHLIYEYYGMAGITAMETFVTEANNLPLFLQNVATQAVTFRDKLATIKEECGAKWKYARVLTPDALKPLNHRNYPDLYNAAIVSAQNKGLLTATNYQKSDFFCQGDDRVIRQMARHLVTPSDILSEATIRNLQSVGAGVADMRKEFRLLGMGDQRAEPLNVLDALASTSAGGLS